ncbi:gliding motility protein [Pyxidicoccus parkwayensis]|uniref:Gliding motility protein n=1 Tax=Pyxidicoccus parkwayensis TaxID=2813578 RepID=A0ABX7NZR4_9BACT|nr:gliding motility protein [Pyxidicoccus parkwaysis]QSQ22909.1 gliding motility protein [Pyxidicoccus parkwaysis]
MTPSAAPAPGLAPTVPSKTSEPLLKLFPEPPERREALGELHTLLASASALAPLPERLAWLEQVVRWLKTDVAVSFRHGLPSLLTPVEAPGSARLRLLVEVLTEVPAWRESVRDVLCTVFTDTSALRLLSEPGLSTGRGLLGDFLGRVGQRLVPAVPDERELSTWVWRWFRTAADAAWLEALAEEHVSALCSLLGPECFAPLGAAVEDAVAVLASRASALGLAADVQSRLPSAPLADSAFVHLPRACEALRVAVRAGSEAQDVEQERLACAEVIARCRADAQAVQQHLHAHAVDTDLVYRVELLGHVLDRLEALLWLLSPDGSRPSACVSVRLLSSLVRAHAQGRSISGLFRGSVRCISRRIFEHTGEVGRHYITTGPDDYHRLVSAAAGGGLLTTGTAALKLLIGFAALPLFFQGLAASANYALSFLLIQVFGFTLATKQPSMTAAALAASMDVKAGDKGMRGLVDHLACITRSQLASVFGNLGTVVTTATFVSILLQALRGHALLSQKEAEYVVHSLHPFHSGTVFFAAFTGVLLWCSSVCGGWLENWVHYRRLPEALARHPGLIRLMGETRARKLGAAFSRKACGLGANVALGLLLGMTPAVSHFFGLPLDVRHVTLSTGTLAFAGAALGPEKLLSPDFLWAVAGLMMVAVANLGVSFGLGLAAAVRSRGLEPVGMLRLARVVLAGGIRSLSDFVLPPQPLLPAHRPSSPLAVRSAARPRVGQRSRQGGTTHH